MNACEKTILSLLARALFGVEKPLEEPVEWEKVCKEAKVHAVLPLVYQALTKQERAQMPQGLETEWKKTLYQRILINEQILYEQTQILQTLRENDIRGIILKGQSAAFHYPDPSQRVLGDIDLLVEIPELDRVSNFLREDDYEEYKDGDLHRSFQKGVTVVEVHKKPITLDFNENPNIEESVRAFFTDIFDKRIDVNGTPVPSYSHQAIILLMHKLTHFLSGELGLRQLCDWAVFVKEQLNETLWATLSPLLDEFGIKTFTLVVTKVCIDYLGLPRECAPWAEESDPTLAKDVIELIIESGNFGRKAGNTYGQRLFVDAHSKNRVASFFKVLGSACRKHWKPCERHPILMPIAPFVVYFKYLKMRKQGKRKKLRLSAMYQRAGTRQKLYQELQPFVQTQKEEKDG